MYLFVSYMIFKSLCLIFQVSLPYESVGIVIILKNGCIIVNMFVISMWYVVIYIVKTPYVLNACVINTVFGFDHIFTCDCHNLGVYSWYSTVEFRFLLGSFVSCLLSLLVSSNYLQENCFQKLIRDYFYSLRSFPFPVFH